MNSQGLPLEPSQLVLRNVAELAQRQQTRELGSALARQIFRLLKVAQFHALDNMAFLQQLDQTVEALKVFGAQSGEPLTLLFAKSTVFVCGQLLKASRSEYEAALELSAMVHRLGVTQLSIQTHAERADLRELARLFQPPMKTKAEHGVLDPSPAVRLRYVSAARLDENDQDMSPEDQILRTYATTVVVMRRVYENLSEARYQLPNQVKRLAQRLVMLSEGDTPAFLGVTAMRNLNHDAAGRSVNRSILAVSMGRQLTTDLATLSRIAMSALFLDVATPLVTGVAGKGGEFRAARMTDAARQRLPAATAAVLTALGHVREASRVRTVIAYEAQWLRQAAELGPMYDGQYRPMVAARIVATAQRFNQLMEADLAASQPPTVDDAIATMRDEARDAVDQAMIALLIAAVGVFPRGTPVALSTGESAVVLRTPDHPADYPRPTVRLVYDAAGKPLRMKVALDLAGDENRRVVRVITNPDATLLEACRAVAGEASPGAKQTDSPPSSSTDSRRASLAGVSEPLPGGARAPSAPAVDFDRATARPRAPSAQRLEVTPAPPEGADSVPDSAPPSSATAPARRARASIVDVVEAPATRRDPRSDDWDDEPLPTPAAPVTQAAPVTRSTSGAPPRRMSQRLSRRPPSVPLDELEELIPDEAELVAADPSDPSSHWRRAPATLPPLPEVGGDAADSTHAPSASGSLERTPFSNVFLYVLDRALGGTLHLTEPCDDEGDEPVEHAVYFEDGLPTKVHTGKRIASLGSMLVAFGVLEQTQLGGDPITQPPTHEATLEAELLASGLVRLEQIAEVRNEQVVERLSSLFGLPPATRYAFYNGFDLLKPIWGEVGGVTSPLGALSRGLREHPEENAMDQLLVRLGGAPLRLHAEADLLSFHFEQPELAVAVAISDAPLSVPDLLELGHDPDVVRRVVYELMLTHCVAPVAPG